MAELEPTGPVIEKDTSSNTPVPSAKRPAKSTETVAKKPKAAPKPTLAPKPAPKSKPKPKPKPGKADATRGAASAAASTTRVPSADELRAESDRIYNENARHAHEMMASSTDTPAPAVAPEPASECDPEPVAAPAAVEPEPAAPVEEVVKSTKKRDNPQSQKMKTTPKPKAAPALKPAPGKTDAEKAPAQATPAGKRPACESASDEPKTRVVNLAKHDKPESQKLKAAPKPKPAPGKADTEKVPTQATPARVSKPSVKRRLLVPEDKRTPAYCPRHRR